MIRPARPSMQFGVPGRTVKPASGTGRPTIGTLLFRQSQALDELMAAIDHPFVSPQQFEQLEARANAIADGLRAAFRSRHPGDPA